MTSMKRKQVELQLEQLKCLHAATYAGMAHDLKITWRYGSGPDPFGRQGVDAQTVEYARDRLGKHEEVTIGVGDAYYGSQSLSALLYEMIGELIQRLRDQLDDMGKERTMADLYSERLP